MIIDWLIFYVFFLSFGTSFLRLSCGVGLAQWLERRTRNRKKWVRIRLVPLSKALYHICFICRQRCNWWSRWPKLTWSVISDVKPIINILHLINPYRLRPARDSRCPGKVFAIAWLLTIYMSTSHAHLNFLEFQKIHHYSKDTHQAITTVHHLTDLANKRVHI